MRKALQLIFSLIVITACLRVFGRGEPWMPKPPTPPSVLTLTNSERYLEWKWREDVTDRRTGADAWRLREEIFRLADELEDKEAWCVVKARLYAHLCDNMAVDVSPLDWFPAFAVWNRYARPILPVVQRRSAKLDKKIDLKLRQIIEEGDANGRWMFWKDFDHSVPEWEKILKLGFGGLHKRMQENKKNEVRYEALQIVSEATLRLLGRLATQARRRLGEDIGLTEQGRIRLKKEADAFEQLAKGPPRSAYEALQMIFLYFFFSEHLDVVQCRSLSIIDVTLRDFYDEDVVAGRTTESEFRDQFRHFLWQWGSIDNYWGQPITMGGTQQNGQSEYGRLSQIILEVMDECALPTPKFHLKIADNTPDWVFEKTLDMACRHRPFSFCGEKAICRILEHYGYTADEARRFYTKGCYEFCCPEGANGTCIGYVNFLKPIEEMLSEMAANRPACADYLTFETEYISRMRETMELAMKIAGEMERGLDETNPANLSTMAVENAVKTGKDAFADGASHGNNTTILTVAFGSAIDALMAINEIVYKKREMSLRELGLLMAQNWRGRDELRRRMLRSRSKWGTNDPDANAAGIRISQAVSSVVNGKPNTRGGMFGLSGHCARQFIVQGRLIGATPDGRMKGEEVSKNLSPTMGADKEGVTALVQTLGCLDSTDWPGDFPLDVMLLPSMLADREGRNAVKALLKVFFDNGGAMMQFNVFDAEELRDAQRHPDRHENLQVRVCGWNVRWNDLPKVEQDAYIRRAEEMAR